jgi:hypothetical protein
MAEATWREFNCYEVLGVAEDATLAEIRAAYRDATRRAHPDRGGSHDAQVKVNLAFEVLSGGLRSEHDAFWRTRRVRRSTSERSAPRRFTRTGNLENLWSRGGDRLSDGRNGGGFAAAVEARLTQERQRLQDDVAFRERALIEEATKKLSRARVESLVALGLAILGSWGALRLPLLWVFVALLLIPLARRIYGVGWQGQRFSVLDLRLQAVRDHARTLAQASADRDAAPLAGHAQALVELKTLLNMPNTESDTALHLARRLAAAFFLIGYTPVRWQEADERLIVVRGDSEVALQVRPSGKQSLSVTQIDRLLSELRAARQREAYLFVLSKVSARARERAGESGVRCFDLAELNEWIPSLLTSGYRGPGGDPLSALTRLRHFLQSLG